jgi:tungstate transport system permease protein
MDPFIESFATAISLIAQAQPRLLAVVMLSLGVSGTACLLASGIGLAAGAALAVSRFPGRRAVLVLLNTSLALPAVVVGLVIYLLLSRSGPLGFWGLLFTPTAMVIAQTVLVLPIVTALTRETVESSWQVNGEQLRSLGAGRWTSGLLLLWDERMALLTVLLAAFGRAIAEVGAVMIVGGNIDGHTRVMTTAIALETSKGDLPLALALGMVLLGVVLVLNVLIALVRGWSNRAQGRSEGAAPGAAQQGHLPAGAAGA